VLCLPLYRELNKFIRVSIKVEELLKIKMSQVQFSAKKVAQEASQWEELNDADLMAVVGGSGGVVDNVTGTATGIIDAKKLDQAINAPVVDNAINGGNLEKTVGKVIEAL